MTLGTHRGDATTITERRFVLSVTVLPASAAARTVAVVEAFGNVYICAPSTDSITPGKREATCDT